MNTARLHILPLHLQLRPDLGIDILCDDPLASLDPLTGILTIDLPRSRCDAQALRLMVRDPEPRNDCYFYATALSGRTRERLAHWSKDGDVWRSPDIPADTAIEVWVSVLALPPNTADAKAYHGRRNVKIATQGGGDLDLLAP